MIFKVGDRVQIIGRHDTGVIVAISNVYKDCCVAYDNNITIHYQVLNTSDISSWQSKNFQISPTANKYIGKKCDWFINSVLKLAEDNTSTNQIKEKLCQVCSKKNDFSALKCWWCENIP